MAEATTSAERVSPDSVDPQADSVESPDPPGSAGATVPRAPRRLWLIVVLQAALMLAMMVLYPTFQEPDEIAHVDYVLAHRHGDWFIDPGKRQYQSGVLAANALVPGIQFQQHVGGKPIVPRADRDSFDELGTAPVNQLITNQMVQHPPLYYATAAGFSYLIPGFADSDFDVQVFWLRIFSLLLMLPVPVLIFGIARRLIPDPNLCLFAAMVPLSMPSYLRTGASVTNDSLLILTGTALIAVLARVATGDFSRRLAVVGGLCWGAALLVKGFALVMPPAIVLAYLVGARGSFRERLRQAFVPVVIMGGVGALVGGWWWVRNVLRYGTIQPAGLGPISSGLRQLIYGKDRPGGSEGDFFTSFFDLLGKRLWGSLGLIDIPTLPIWILITISIVYVLLIITGSIRWATRDGWTPARAAVLILPTVLTLGVMYVGSRSYYLQGRQLPAIQARYLLTAVAGLAVCTAAGVGVLLRRRSTRWLPPVALTGAVMFIAASALQVLNVTLSSNEPSLWRRLLDGTAYAIGWSPWSDAVAKATLVLAGLVTMVTLVAFWRAAAQAPRRGAVLSESHVTDGK